MFLVQVLSKLASGARRLEQKERERDPPTHTHTGSFQTGWWSTPSRAEALAGAAQGKSKRERCASVDVLEY
jgi:hypothetical protein